MYNNPSVMDARANNPEIIHEDYFASFCKIIPWIMEGLFSKTHRVYEMCFTK